MKIIYPSTNDDGETTLAQMVAAPKFLAQLAVLDVDGNDTVTLENKLIHIANKDLPTGTKYEITDADLSDRSFRNAWEYVAGASEKTSEDLSLDDQLKYNKITQEEYDANAG
jgi:hypothetical protein